MNGLDLFSGIGGLSIALEPWVKTIAYCERDRYAQAVLLSRMADGSIDKAPIWDDVTSLRGAMLPSIDIIYGGFPCQDISCAGRGKGLAGDRSVLFFEIIRLAEETRASFVFLENVPAIRTRGLREVIRAFTDLGYDCRWTRVSASSVGAPHKRERWFMLAHTNSTELRDKQRRRSWQSWQRANEFRNNGSQEPLAHSGGKGLPSLWYTSGISEKAEGRSSTGLKRRSGPSDSREWWSIEPNVGRVANGIPSRVDRIKCLGNAVVPSQARKAFKKLMGERTP